LRGSVLVRAGGVLRTTEDDVNGVMASEDFVVV
jgi:hypothetical protein